MARRAIAVGGMVQGVGFRPFIFGLASRLGLHGFVRNQTDGVLIEVEGAPGALDQFLLELTEKPPPRAQIHRVQWVSQLPRGEQEFRIETSEKIPAGLVFIQPDIGTCENCLAELFDAANRRFRYPFLNCSDCGPRLTIIQGTPYDRVRTTMAGFSMCSACRLEYRDPTNRRFHAQPTACPTCGPQLEIRDASGKPILTTDPLALAIEALKNGGIVAVKGLGGFHLACVGHCSRTVAELRRRKQRDEKPFALMVANLPAAQEICEVSAQEEKLLLSPGRPIVLLRRRPAARIAGEVSPRNPHLGVMLPYTPLHHLLLGDLKGMPLVMTSGNRSDEPIAYEDPDALARLTGIADFFLTHNRPIHLRCDDSVTRMVAGEEVPLRRSRGYAPQPLPLPIELTQPTLALGGQLKATFALGRGQHAFLSHHLGDLDHYEAYRAYVQAIHTYQQLFAVPPELLVHDLHPDYASTRFALELAQSKGIKLLGTQHHHAHLASCMAEHGLQGPVLGVIFDGTGYGTDGTVWGGEFLVGDYRTFRRVAHFRYIPMPGGDLAIREPWRMAVAYLSDSGLALLSHLGNEAGGERNENAAALSMVKQMVERRVHAPLTSSVGRLFDAVASLAHVRQRVGYEGQAAMELEWLASEAAPDGCYPFELSEGGLQPGTTTAKLQPAMPVKDKRTVPLQIDCRSLIAAVVRDAGGGVTASLIGRRFHSTLVEIIAQVCRHLQKENGLNRVVLSGGVFMNALLLQETVARLAESGFEVYRHRRVPPNDGGLCLGQLAIAASLVSGE